MKNKMEKWCQGWRLVSALDADGNGSKELWLSGTSEMAGVFMELPENKLSFLLFF